ncbi:MAG: enoyl-CoA hydratase-related protein [Mycobacterium sp.]
MTGVGVRREGHLLVVTLDEPRTRNAMTQRMAHQVGAAMDELDQDDTLRAGIITGAGGFFCAGQNLADADEGRFARTDSRGWWGFASRPPRKPLIAAVDGMALGGGFEIALCCDLIVAGGTTEFGLPEVGRGMVAVGGGLTRLPRRVPYHLAVLMALTGERVSARTLAGHGLVARIVESGPALAGAVELGRAIIEHPRTAVGHTLDVIRVAGASDLGTSILHQDSRVSVDELRLTPDYREGVASFKEKRPPRWLRGATHD